MAKEQKLFLLYFFLHIAKWLQYNLMHGVPLFKKNEKKSSNDFIKKQSSKVKEKS